MQGARAEGHEPAARTVGLRELRARAGQIVREVRETGRPIDITVRGEVVARLTPSPEQPEPAERRDAARAWLEETETFAREVARHHPSLVSAVDLVRDQRRDL